MTTTIIKTLEKLRNKALTQIISSKAEYTRYLNYAARMFRYPFGDTLVMYRQNPDAEAIASQQDWLRVGRDIVRDADTVAENQDRHTERQTEKQAGQNLKPIYIIDPKNPAGYSQLYELSQTQGKPFTFAYKYDIPHDDEVRLDIISLFESRLQVQTDRNHNDNLNNTSNDNRNNPPNDNLNTPENFNTNLQHHITKHIESIYPHTINQMADKDKRLSASHKNLMESKNFKSLAIASAVYTTCRRFGITNTNLIDEEAIANLKEASSPAVVVILGRLCQELTLDAIGHTSLVFDDVRRRGLERRDSESVKEAGVAEVSIKEASIAEISINEASITERSDTESSKEVNSKETNTKGAENYDEYEPRPESESGNQSESREQSEPEPRPEPGPEPNPQPQPRVETNPKNPIPKIRPPLDGLHGASTPPKNSGIKAESQDQGIVRESVRGSGVSGNGRSQADDGGITRGIYDEKTNARHQQLLGDGATPQRRRDVRSGNSKRGDNIQDKVEPEMPETAGMLPATSP